MADILTPACRQVLRLESCILDTFLGTGDYFWVLTIAKPGFGSRQGYYWASQVVLLVKNSPSNAGDLRDSNWIPGLGRFPGGGLGNPLQYSCLENPMDRGAWPATVHRVAELHTTEATQQALVFMTCVTFNKFLKRFFALVSLIRRWG